MAVVLILVVFLIVLALVLNRLIRFSLEKKLVVLLLALFAVVAGVMFAPFDWDTGPLRRDPVPVDAIPDIGENQQIVFTRWMGRSPQDVEDQIGYPLTVALLGVPSVKTIRSLSMFGFSSIYVIFKEDVDFYWSRSRVLEKLNSLPSGTLPPGVQPMLGPDATALGQIFWYTLEGSEIASATLQDRASTPLDALWVQARNGGEWGNRLSVDIADGTKKPTTEFKLVVKEDSSIVERWDGLSMDPEAENYVEKVVNGRSKKVKVTDLESATPAPKNCPAVQSGTQLAGGAATGGWDLQELRSIQDWNVRYALLSADGVAEVASVGGFVKEYQIDVDPDAMRAYGVSLDQVFMAVKMSNVDVGARTIEVNKVEYVIRGLGFIESVEDVENTVVAVRNNVPVYVKTVAHVALGPALRRGALDKEGAEAVGGVVVVRYGENPLAAIKNVKEKIEEISDGLGKKALVDWRAVTPEKVKAFAEESGIQLRDSGHPDADALLKWAEEAPQSERPKWLTVSQVTIVPFYDRTGLIYETLGTLNSALTEEMLVTIIVVLVMVMHLRSSVLISGLLPIAVLMCFGAMKAFRVDANIVALSGIAIAIGTMVDMGIVICENILKHLDEASSDEDRLEVVYRASSEVGGAVVTAIATTVVGFLPVFMMTGAEGKLFKPLAFTKTFALLASVIVALFVIPPAAQALFTWKIKRRTVRLVAYGLVASAGLVIALAFVWWAGLLILFIGAYHIAKEWMPEEIKKYVPWAATGIAVFAVLILLSDHWTPLGPERGLLLNLIFAGLVIGGILGFFRLFQHFYAPILKRFLDFKAAFLLIPVALVVAGVFIWRGLGKEFMPPLDEGSYLYMPSTMPHASIGESLDALQKQDMAIRAIPEVETVVGKIGRAETPLDPAPVSMVETVIIYLPEFKVDKDGRRLTYRFDPGETDLFRNEEGDPVPAKDGKPYVVQGRFERDADGRPVRAPGGKPFRLWRPALDQKLNPDRKPWGGITKPDDIWTEIVHAAQVPGSTSAPRLQPIATRIVMLQSGMKAKMGVKVYGNSLEEIEKVGLDIERLLKQVPSVNPDVVSADRIVGKPYLEIDIDRKAIARYGIHIRQVQNVIEVAIGGKRITTTVEGRERYPVRVRYMRELRDRIETLGRILVPARDGAQIPLDELADIRYVRGPQVLKSEDTKLVGYVTFDMRPGHAEVDVVEEAQDHLRKKIATGELEIPDGMSYRFAGTYESQLRSAETLLWVLPFALVVIFIILYLQFNSIPTTLIVFSGIVVAWAGGFVMIWLYGQPWFLDFSLFGVNMRELFQVHPINLSVAVWVGFLALFGIASDDGVVMATYLVQSFGKSKPSSVARIRAATLAAGMRRIRPCLMTTATTIIALVPVLTSTGRGADVMVPMAIPVFGGMVFEVITLFVVPVLYCMIEELKLGLGPGTSRPAPSRAGLPVGRADAPGDGAPSGEPPGSGTVEGA